MFIDNPEQSKNAKPEITEQHVKVLALHATEYLLEYLGQDMMGDAEGNVFTQKHLPHLLAHMLNEAMTGPITAGFMGYLIGKGINLAETRANRSVIPIDFMLSPFSFDISVTVPRV